MVAAGAGGRDFSRFEVIAGTLFLLLQFLCARGSRKGRRNEERSSKPCAAQQQSSAINGRHLPSCVRALSSDLRALNARSRCFKSLKKIPASELIDMDAESRFRCKREPTTALAELTQIMCVSVLKHMHKDTKGHGR